MRGTMPATFGRWRLPAGTGTTFWLLTRIG
jgi:hypothetical protein